MTDEYEMEYTREDELLEQIAELEKENAELKEELRDANEKVVHLACNQNKDLKYKLTKAKEIISNLYAICKDNHYPNTSVLIEQAEQFLKECE